MSKSTVKKVTKKSQGDAIFATELTNRTAGSFDSNKAFRAAVINRMVSEIGVSTASASTMFNQCKKAAEAADTTVALGRDPKKVVTKAKPKVAAVPVQAPETEEVTA